MPHTQALSNLYKNTKSLNTIMKSNQDSVLTSPSLDIFAAKVTVLDDFGLHARPAAYLAKLAQNFEAEISLSAGGQTADAKSILDILSLAAARDTELKVICRGKDAQGAGQAVVKLFESRFKISEGH